MINYITVVALAWIGLLLFMILGAVSRLVDRFAPPAGASRRASLGVRAGDVLVVSDMATQSVCQVTDVGDDGVVYVRVVQSEPGRS